MEFIKALKTELLEDFNESITENGAVGYRTSGKALLDLNFAVASLRSASPEKIIEMFQKAYFEDKLLALKWLFFARDVRGGLGERRLFRICIQDVALYDPDIVENLIPLIAEYGRYDDLLCLLDSDALRANILGYLCDSLNRDIDNYNNDKPISLLAKWMPSINTSSEETRKYAKMICSALNLTERRYRKLLSTLRGYLNVVEKRMSSKEWTAINYEAVPSRANLIYNNAFLRNDEKRRRAYLSKLEKGEAKINAAVLYPHDIVSKYFDKSYWGGSVKGYDAALESMWKALPNTVNGDSKTIVVADGSGSMTTRIGRTDVTALDVANGLAIYFAEKLSGEFKDKYITFSERPQLVDFAHLTSLRDKLMLALRYNEVANTNIEAVFDLILKTAIDNQMSQSDIPANVLIISDMEFDDATGSRMFSPWGRTAGAQVDAKLFKQIEQKYAAAGYKLPRLVFWNVNSRTGTIPVRQNENGVALVSGFSVNVCKMVMSGKTDPFECLLETLNSERYHPIEEAVNA